MMRAFVVAFVTFLVSWFAGSAAAQTGAAPVRIPVTITGAVPGVDIEFHLNAGKIADATANATGGVNWVLDLSNMGKPKVTIYVDVCKDGKIVKVLFVTGDGPAPPEDESCRRRMGAFAFQSDCGAVRITLDLTNFGGRVVGCGLSFRDPKLFGPVVGGIVAVPLLLAGGGGGSPTATATPPVPIPPSVTLPPAVPTNSSTPAPAPVEFTVTMPVGSWNHPPGANTSFVCTVVVTTPPQPGASWTATVQGPFVAPGQNFSGTLNARGQADIRATITNVGGYTFTVTVTSGGQTRSGTSNTINVTFLNSNCPQAQT